MADIEPQTQVESTPVEDVEMGGAAETEAGAEAGAGAGEEETGLTNIEVEEPKLVLFSE